MFFIVYRRRMNNLKSTRSEMFFPMAFAITATGLWLRLHAADSDLWLDELWSLALVSRIHSAGAVFWNINHANNHFLNSLWMYGIGQNATVFLYRLPALIFGTAAIPVAGWVARRHGMVAILAVMLLFSINFIMIDLSSQARGYAGLVLFTLLAIGFSASALDLKQPRLTDRSSWLLGVCVMLGFLSQIIMMQTVAVIGLWTLRTRFSQTGPTLRTVWDTAVVMAPSAFLTAPFIVCMVLNAGKFDLGNVIAFDPLSFWVSYGMLLQILVGSDHVQTGVCLAGLAALLCSLGYVYFKSGRRELFYSTALVLVPIIFFAGRLPNTNYPRYFLPFGVIFILGIGELYGHLCSRSKGHKIAASIGLAAIIFFNICLISIFFSIGRGEYLALAKTMVRDDTIRYGTTQPAPASAVFDYYGRKLGVRVIQTPREQWCTARPDWFVFTDLAHLSIEQVVSRVEEECGYKLKEIPFEGYGLSASGWHVYHPEPAVAK